MDKTAGLPKASFKKVKNIFIVIILLSASFISGYAFGIKGFSVQLENQYKIKIDRQQPANKNVDFGLFWKVWDILGAKYFDKTKMVPSEMVYGAISGMVSSLGDPYTAYLPPKENKIVKEDLSGELEGIGINIGFRNSTLAVISPLEGSPAQKNGLKAGDYILKIKDTAKSVDTDTSKLSLMEAVRYIRGKAGTKVTLTLAREGTDKPFEVEIAREKINIPSVTLSFTGENNHIAHIKLSKFAEDTDLEWVKKVNEIISNKSVDSVILDMRNNGGGYMEMAVVLASDFIEPNKTVVTEDRGNGVKFDKKTDISQKLVKYKTVVLVNEGSASASEILAGALRDQKQIKLIGTKTFGKGTVQEPVEFPDGSSLHVTIEKYLNPSGFWVHEKGLTPDVEVKDDENTADVDEQLQKAIKEIES